MTLTVEFDSVPALGLARTTIDVEPTSEDIEVSAASASGPPWRCRSACCSASSPSCSACSPCVHTAAIAPADVDGPIDDDSDRYEIDVTVVEHQPT